MTTTQYDSTYTDLMRPKALITADAADKLLAYIEQDSARHGSHKHAAEAGALRATVWLLVSQINRLHAELKYAAYETCSAYWDLNKRRLADEYGIDLEAMAEAAEAKDDPEDEDEDADEEMAALNREFIRDQMRGMRRG